MIFFIRPGLEYVKQLEVLGFTFDHEESYPDFYWQFLEEFPDAELIIKDSTEIIAETILSKKSSSYFNGERYGIYDANLYHTTGKDEEQHITICFYTTDYFTHLVMEDAEEKLKSISNSVYLNDLNSIYPAMRTSFGVSIILLSKNSDRILMTNRSKNARYTEGRDKLYYVSATEAISSADYNNTYEIDLFKAVERGLEEELGIDSTELEDIFFLSYFFEHNYTQDGMLAVAVLNEDVALDSIIDKPAQDKALESNEIFWIDSEIDSIRTWLRENSEYCQYQTIYSLEIFMSHRDLYFL